MALSLDAPADGPLLGATVAPLTAAAEIVGRLVWPERLDFLDFDFVDLVAVVLVAGATLPAVVEDEGDVTAGWVVPSLGGVRVGVGGCGVVSAALAAGAPKSESAAKAESHRSARIIRRSNPG